MTKVGVTGHQRLQNAAAWSWVTNAIRAELISVTRPLVGVTSLAVGVDQLFAKVVLELGGTIHAVLPFSDIERSFSPEDLPSYRRLVEQATVEVISEPGSDQDSYLAAGQRVVELSELVLAVWNGKPALGKGGTADVVAYASVRHVPLVLIDPESRTVQRH